MESSFRKAKSLWTGAGTEPDDSLEGGGQWETLYEQRVKICPGWDEYVQMGCAKMAKFGGGFLGESVLPEEPDDASLLSDGSSCRADGGRVADDDGFADDAVTLETTPSSAVKTKRGKPPKSMVKPPGLDAAQADYEKKKKQAEQRSSLAVSDAETMKEIVASELQFKIDSREAKELAKKMATESATATRNAATAAKYSFKEKELEHARAMDLRMADRQMSIDESKAKRDDLRLQFKLLKEMQADYEKNEAIKLDRVFKYQGNGLWDRLSEDQQNALILPGPAPTMQSVRDLM